MFVLKNHWKVLSAFVVLLLAFHFLIQGFFPLPNGEVGSDYALGLPILFDGLVWLKQNGFWHVPWFTPSFCGGVPSYFDPQSSYFTIQQLLTLWVNPLQSYYFTILIFAGIGFWGFYWLLTRIFHVSWQSAVLGGALFMFNGFFVSRMLIGHTVFMGFMLVPFLAYCLLRKNVFWMVCAGLLIAYWIQMGMVSLIISALLAVLMLCLLAAYDEPRMMKSVAVYFAGALVLAVLLSAAKLVGMLAFLTNFPRNDYLLPGANGFWYALQMGVRILFFPATSASETILPHVTNSLWVIGQHEFEYSVSWVPLVIFVAVVPQMFMRKKIFPRKKGQLVILGLLFLLMLLPFLLNTYYPFWNAVLKKLPVISSSSNLFRWYVMDIPIIIALAVLCVSRIDVLQQKQNFICGACVVLTLLAAFATDRTYYKNNTYTPDKILASYERVQHAAEKLQITGLTAPIERDAFGYAYLEQGRNDAFTEGLSPIACYNPVFGYRLENFVVKTLHVGAVLDERGGVLNVKNPACYVYPTENHCAPGDHFTVQQKNAAREFVSYRPFLFAVSFWQEIADWVNLVVLVGVVGFLGGMLICALVRALF